MEEPKPIFVVGKHRSGTTGLANHLCEHPEIAGVQHQKHWGIHESGYFAYVVDRYGPLTHWPNYREFVEVMSASDYFRLAGVEKEYMLSLWPTTYAGFFGSVMNELSRRQDAQYWLEKSPAHTKKVLQLAEEYPEAKFVAIIRNVADVVASSLSHSDDGNVPEYERGERVALLARVVVGWVYYNKSIHALREKYRGRTKVVRYEDFRDSKRSVLEGVCAFLEVDYIERMCTLPYTRNSSFSDGQTRKKAITRAEKTYSQKLATLLAKVPYKAYQLMDLFYSRFRSRVDLPRWYFRLSDREMQSEYENERCAEQMNDEV
jgi:hypothetical protein